MIPLFKIRCSAIGQIMGGSVGLSEPQKKKVQTLQDKMKAGKNLTILQAEEYHKLLGIEDNPQLPAGAKTYCKKWVKEKLYNRRKEIKSKFIDKGNACEAQSLELINAQCMEDYELNTEYKENEYLTGTCDIQSPSEIRDIKNSWSVDTFPLFDTGIKNKDYWWQGQGYLDLYDKQLFHLDYTLIDAPLHLIKQEAKSIAYRDNLDYDTIFSEVHSQMTYSDIPQHLKHKTFPANRDREAIKQVYARVELCREYIAGLIETIEVTK